MCKNSHVAYGSVGSDMLMDCCCCCGCGGRSHDHCCCQMPEKNLVQILDRSVLSSVWVEAKLKVDGFLSFAALEEFTGMCRL